MATKQKTTTSTSKKAQSTAKVASKSSSKKVASKPTSQSVEKPTEIVSTSTAKIEQPRSNNKWLIPTVLGIALLVLGGMWVRRQLIVATVNGQPIYRYQIIRELEKQGGKQILDQQITELLIQNAASQQGVSVSDAQIDEEIASINQELSAQGQDLNTILIQQGLSQSELRHQIRMQKTMEQLVPTPAAPNEEEIATELEAQAGFFPDSMSEDDKRTAITNQLSQQRESMATQTWLEDLKTNGNVQYLFNY